MVIVITLVSLRGSEVTMPLEAETKKQVRNQSRVSSFREASGA